MPQDLKEVTVNRSPKSEVQSPESGLSLMLGCCIAAVVALAQLGNAQTIPVMLYGGAQSEKCYALVEAVDSGFCLAGWTRSFGTGAPAFSNVLVTRTDAQGLPVWSRVSQGTNDDEAYSMVRTEDDGYVLTGWTKSYGPSLPYKNVFVIKLDASGNHVWGRVYGGPNDDEAYSIIQTSDGGYAVCGRTSSWGPAPMPNLFVMKLDPLGNLVWLRTYWAGPMHMEDEAYSIVSTPDSGYAVCGRLKATGPTQFDAFLLKLDQYGNAQWMRVVPGETEDEAYSVADDLMGHILVAGWTQSYGSHPFGPADIFVAGFGLDGTSLWSRTYGWPTGEEQVLDDRSLVATADGGSAVCGLTTSVGPGIPAPNFLILKLDPMGFPMWCRSHPSPYWPGNDSDVALAMIERTGTGYAVAGFSNSWPLLGGGDDFMLSTFDAGGNRPVCTEPQYPQLESLPWTQWYVEDTVVRPGMDSMKLVQVAIKHDSVCYDTTQSSIEETMNDEAMHETTMNDERLSLRATRFGVELNLSAGKRVSVSLFSADGRQLTVLANREFAAGAHLLGVPVDLPCGTYLVRAEAGNRVASAKVVRF